MHHLHWIAEHQCHTGRLNCSQQHPMSQFYITATSSQSINKNDEIAAIYHAAWPHATSTLQLLQVCSILGQLRPHDAMQWYRKASEELVFPILSHLFLVLIAIVDRQQVHRWNSIRPGHRAPQNFIEIQHSETCQIKKMDRSWCILDYFGPGVECG